MLFMMKIMWTCRVATICLSRDAVSFTDCLLTTSQQDVSGIKTIRPVSTPPTFGITRIFLQTNDYDRFPRKSTNQPSQRKRSISQQNLAADDGRTETFVTFDPLPDCWKANFRFNCTEYWLNCNLL